MTSGDETTGDPLVSVEWVCEQLLKEGDPRDSVEVRKAADHLFKSLHSSLRAPLAEYWKTGQVDMNLAVHGWSLQKLIDKGVTVCVSGAFSWLNALIADPETTTQWINEPRDFCDFGFSEEERSEHLKKTGH